jgi:hypothetical protein
MSQTRDYLKRLARLDTGELTVLRSLAGRPLSDRLHGFDLFTGMWWPLRQRSPRTPRREPSWVVAKLWATYGRQLPFADASDVHPPGVAALLGSIQPRDENERGPFRHRVQGMLACNVRGVERPLRWALDSIAAVHHGRPLDWVGLLTDLSKWDEPGTEFAASDIRIRWAREYLAATRHPATG